MKVTVKVEGLRDLDAALSELPKITTAKAVVRRVLKKAAEPLRALAEQTAPRLTGALKISIVIGTKLTRRQARMARKEPKSLTEMFIGTSNPAAVPQEFGTHDQKAQPFMRPAWQATKDQVLTNIGNELGPEIEKTAARLAKKAARGG
ncbi:HK97 gp10 family phage protein [Sphingomonas sp. HHU CXW]|uniref:HK97 gp10 family phage protein n=1 Tax=Sphingomonas hominis TaxID=2741495 RepID=A0ABX2JEX2_9SPHN|nr:HK97 gp10 family phage protein [Sphingomonas hominis]